MKKMVPFVTFLFLLACNNEVPTTTPAAIDNLENRDSTMIASDSTSIQTATEVAETSKELRPPPPPFAPKQGHPSSKKTVTKPKAKIDSIAIREANKLPLDQ